MDNSIIDKDLLSDKLYPGCYGYIYGYQNATSNELMRPIFQKMSLFDNSFPIKCIVLIMELIVIYDDRILCK